jgi:hypothetical protein
MVNWLRIGLVCLTAITTYAQNGNGNGNGNANGQNKTGLTNQLSVPEPVRGYMKAFGDRLERSGKERTVLTGSYTSASGTGQAQLTFDLPGNVRFDRSDKAGKPLIYDSNTGLSNGASLVQEENDILESLFDDATESFVLGFSNGNGYRFLGMFRSDDGKTPNFTGPSWEIYDVYGPARGQSVKVTRYKRFYFDSATKLLTKAVYSSSGKSVETEFSAWTTVAGQAFPGKIARKENGAVVFQFTINAGVAGAKPTTGN